MPIFTDTPPLALYIHLPWCVQKCPYCDFNSHAVKDNLPEDLYTAALIGELAQHAESLRHRPLVSIFFGGGTPSLFSGKAIGNILDGVAKHLQLPATVEITLEANPGTVDRVHFADYRSAGVNRLSLGIQSLQDDKLKALGRIHDQAHALKAVDIAKRAGFDNFNLDIMFGLPGQSQQDALHDLTTALACEPAHFSWYQLTIEPNTLFHHQRPTLPEDESIWEMQQAGQAILRQHGFEQYEVSAYATKNKECAHNRNYWEFGDYLGIGAGAHSKLTNVETGHIERFAQTRHPKAYLDIQNRGLPVRHQINDDDIIFEFMLNALRLTHGVSTELFTARTGLPYSLIADNIKLLQQRKLLTPATERIQPSETGYRYLNNVIEMFLQK